MPLNFEVRLAALRQAREFENAWQNPAATQAKVLAALLAKNAKTVFGQEHYFAQQVPLRNYEGHRKYVDRAIAGEADIPTPLRGVCTRQKISSTASADGFLAE